MTIKSDFSGYVTRADLECADGRVIKPEAFKHMDGKTVPLVWQHAHNDHKNVLGHVLLEAREDGVYGYGYFNDTESGKNARALVEHKDISSLSIYANNLRQRAKQVLHGFIREVSLVLSGANPGAYIENVSIAHADGFDEELDDEAVIYTGLDIELTHSADDTDILEEDEDMPNYEEDDEDVVEHAEAKDKTVKQVYDSFTDEQKDVVHFLIGAALEDAGKKNSAAQSGIDYDDDEDTLAHHQEGFQEMNVFEQDSYNGSGTQSHVPDPDTVKDIVAHAKQIGSLKEAVQHYADEYLEHGINDIDVLFPDARDPSGTPQWHKRRTEWVSGVLNGVNKTPFSRIKTRTADLTHDEARAKGYVKGDMKKEEFFGMSQRSTTPTTIYKKQKLDRDDMLDITDFDVVVWMKGEMRIMLEEEIARAILIGDGRDIASPDKVKDPIGAAEGSGIRSIYHDHELFVTTVWVNIDDADSDYSEVVDEVIRSRQYFRGSGEPTFYTTAKHTAEMLLIKDGFKRRMYNSLAELSTALMVKGLVNVEPMETVDDLIGIIVNLNDYTVGADKGGDVSMFDDFDIDYNQYKYLIETRVSGALTRIKSALVIKKTAGTNVLVAPNDPAFDGTDVTITDQTGVEYYNAADDTAMNALGSPYTVASGTTLEVYALPAAGYYFANDAEDQWSFTNPA